MGLIVEGGMPDAGVPLGFASLHHLPILYRP